MLHHDIFFLEGVIFHMEVLVFPLRIHHDLDEEHDRMKKARQVKDRRIDTSLHLKLCSSNDQY